MDENEIDKKILELKLKKKQLQEKKFTKFGKEIAKELGLKTDEDFLNFLKEIRVEIERAKIKNSELKKTNSNPNIYPSNMENWSGENN